MKPNKPNPGESLADLNPELAKQWHPNRNGNLAPYDVTPRSNKKVWWKCPKGEDHEWKAAISSRNNGRGCPICSNQLVTKSNCLATLNPELAKEWHPTKNVNFTPYDVTPGSNKKVWWKCPKGDDHEWQASVRARNAGNGCGVCSGKVVVGSNCLATLNPALAKEWHPTKNENLTPYDVIPGTHKKVWWKCPKGDDHEWKASVNHRNRGSGCGVCSGKIVVRSNCLATLNPALAKEWHPSKNGTLQPGDVTSGSNKKVWWKCPKGDDHEWKATIVGRNNGIGCPICSNRIITSSNCLATLNPKLSKEWHPIKNGNLTPYDVTPGSNKKVWWKCSKGDDHEWETSIAKRSEGTGCPICTNKVVTKSNCLATLNPELAKEWHPTKNGNITPYDVTPGSNKTVWWKCPEGGDHEWQASVNARNTGRGCGVCSGNIVVRSNCLATLNPALAKEWHPSKNGNLTPYDVIPGTHKKVWWKCPKGDDHEWKATIVGRNNGIGCSICSNQKVVKSNCLATLNSELAKEWHPTKNGNLTPYDVIPGTPKKVWWKCPKGEDHEWKAAVSSRNKGIGCPVCSNKIVTKSNCLATLNPELAKEWHPSKNGKLTPNDIGLGSGKKVWWMCKKGHEWKTSLDHRKRGRGCPLCRNASSAPELRIFCELKTIFPTTQHRVKIEGYEVDILIPELKIGIEYDGVYWHRNKKTQDIAKYKGLKDKIWLIRVREKGLPLLSNTDIEMKTVDISIAIIKKILRSILKQRQIDSQETKAKINEYLKNSHWIASESFNKLFAARDHIDFEESISFLFPDIASEWHPSKNDPLLPEYFSPGSSKIVWWKCPIGEDHEWQSTISNRIIGRGCPICSSKKVVESNCLATLNPELAKEWHPTKNGNRTPYDVTPGSYKKVWWKCPKGEDHEWKAAISTRNNGIGCPICSNRKAVKSNCLLTNNPSLSKEWHPTKNGELTPSDVTPGSHKKVWWKCLKGEDHEWEAIIKARNRGTGCPMCANKVLVESNCLATLNPELAKEWHPIKNGNLTPQDVTSASTKKVWWQGKCGHEWQAKIGYRTRRGQGCPQCKGKRISQTKRLKKKRNGQLPLFGDKELNF